MKDSLVQQCLDILKREDIKNECNLLSSSVINYIFNEIQPYVFVAILFVVMMFVMNFIMLIMLYFLLRNKQSAAKL